MGTLTSTGAARIEFTCFNVSDPSEIYDTAEAACVIKNSATSNGGGPASGAPASLPTAPQGSVNASVARAYTHDQCTHLNDDPISGQGPFTGSGTLTVIATDLGSATVNLNWRTNAFSTIGS